MGATLIIGFISVILGSVPILIRFLTGVITSSMVSSEGATSWEMMFRWTWEVLAYGSLALYALSGILWPFAYLMDYGYSQAYLWI